MGERNPMAKVAKKSEKKVSRKKVVAKTSSAEGKGYARVSDAAVLKATGKNWEEWLAVLDKFDVGKNGHAAAAEFLSEKKKVKPWWSQMVVVGYEQARGLRKEHETPKGFSASASKTFAAEYARVWEYWLTDALRTRWIGAGSEVKAGRTGRSMTLKSKDGKKVSVWFVDKPGKSGAAKCLVSVQQNGLRTEEEVQNVKSIWKSLLGKLEAELAKNAKQK